jgi:hypothetical protein
MILLKSRQTGKSMWTANQYLYKYFRIDKRKSRIDKILTKINVQ